MSGSIIYDEENEEIISDIISSIGSYADLTGPNSGTEVVQLTGTWVGTLIAEGSQDGSNFLPIPDVIQSNGLFISAITANGIYTIPSNGYVATRLVATAWTSGSVNITAYGSNEPSIVYTDTKLRGSTDGTLIGNVADKLKVTGPVTIVDPISGNPLNVLPDGSINVNVISGGGGGGGSPENILSFYNESTSVPSGSPTTILTYTTPATGIYAIQRVLYAGENIARYQLLVNSNIICTKRTYFGGELDGDIDFNASGDQGFLLNAGDVVTVVVLQNRLSSADFEATLEILELITLPPTGSGSFKAFYNEINLIASGITTNIYTYTVPSGITSTLQRIMVSGENIAKYQIVLNSSVMATKRTYFGGDLNATFEFSGNSNGGVVLTPGDILYITVIHNRPASCSFESTLETIEI